MVNTEDSDSSVLGSSPRVPTMNVKQYIIMRKDLKMRRGKEIAQGSHASMLFLLRSNKRSKAEQYWLDNRITKVCLQVNSEEELLEIHQKAIDAGLVSHIVRDAGLTEFDGVPTYTCLAIGPEEVEKVNPITGHLKLY